MNAFFNGADLMENVTASVNITTPYNKYGNNKVPYLVSTSTDIRYVPLAIIGIIGNGISVAILRKSRTRSSGSEMLILNQSIIDLVASIFVLCCKSYWPFDRENISGLWGQFLCVFWLSDALFWSLFTTSSYNLVILTIERYLSVVKPIFHRAKVTRNLTIVACLISWLIGPISMFSLLAATSRLDKGNCNVWMPAAKWNSLYLAFTCAVTYLIPIVFFVALYTHMIVRLHTKVQPSLANSLKSVKTNRSIFRTVVSIVACYIICNTPNQLPFFEYYIKNSRVKLFNKTFVRWSVVFVISNFCINPIVYAFQYEIFKKGLRKFISGKSLSSKSSFSVQSHEHNRRNTTN